MIIFNQASRYLTRHIIASIAFTSAVIYSIFQIGNITDHIGQFDFSAPAQFKRALADSVYISLASLVDLAPVCVLIGTMRALNNLQNSRQLLIFKISGTSIWRILAGPVLALALIGGLISFAVDPGLIKLDNYGEGGDGRFFTANRDVWISQTSEDGNSYIHADTIFDGGAGLRGVTVFTLSPDTGLSGRIEAGSGVLNDGVWTLTNGTIYESDRPASTFGSYILLSNLTQDSVVLSVGQAKSLPIWDLILRFREVDPRTVSVSGAHMRYHSLIAKPLALVGGLLIAFAFSSRYQRIGASGSSMFYGIVLGFVIFVLTKMAEDAGASGVLDPRIAAWGPPLVAILASATILLYAEDG